MYHNISLRSNQIIDHLDRNPANNSIKNLRLVSSIENSQNRTVRRDSKTGIKGVEKVGKNYRSIVTINKKRNYLGTFETVEEAKSARLKKINGLNKLGYKFNE